MRKITSLLFIISICFIGYSNYLSHPIYSEFESEQHGSISIASIEKAITLGRDSQGDIFLLTFADEKKLQGINLTKLRKQKYTDALEAYQQLRKEQLIEIYNSAQSEHLNWSQLHTPALGQRQHIAVGTNYRAHAEEVGLDGKPFLFPKLSAPTSWNSAVKSSARLDHEVELCALPVSDYQRGDSIEFGYVLCSDFTQRWLLLKNINLSGKMGKTGFADAKGGESHLPLGPFLLIPHQDDLFTDIELSLYVNEQKRQQANISQMV